MRDAGTALNVLRRLALTPGGGSNTKMREARRRLTGTWKMKHQQQLTYITLHIRDITSNHLFDGKVEEKYFGNDIYFRQNFFFFGQATSVWKFLKIICLFSTTLFLCQSVF